MAQQWRTKNIEQKMNNILEDVFNMVNEMIGEEECFDKTKEYSDFQEGELFGRNDRRKELIEIKNRLLGK